MLTSSGMCSRGYLAKELRLSKMTISNIVAYLNQKGIICESEYVNTSTEKVTGPKPVMLSIKPNRILSIGLCITKVSMMCGLVDLVDGRIIDSVDVKHINYTKDRFLNRVNDLIDMIYERNQESVSNVVGIGIACTGLIDSHKGLILVSPREGRHSINIK
ncbi:hypothetical protein lbkm_3174 [Lachnospiraceae bacterium KM106-2]|nr:hypothetical protein lbkm_3174 [Lachnospiraceae bacterium KM106-2]